MASKQWHVMGNLARRIVKQYESPCDEGRTGWRVRVNLPCHQRRLRGEREGTLQGGERSPKLLPEHQEYCIRTASLQLPRLSKTIAPTAMESLVPPVIHTSASSAPTGERLCEAGHHSCGPTAMLRLFLPLSLASVRTTEMRRTTLCLGNFLPLHF